MPTMTLDAAIGPPSLGTPGAEWPIDHALVAALLADQQPDLADLPLQEVEAGWDNATFRLGAELAVRLPRRAAAAALIHNEQRWLPLLARQLPLPIPAPLRVGVPGRGYPCSWSVGPWLAGSPADHDPPADGEAARLAAFLRALHVAAPPDAPRNPVRGVPLQERAAVVDERLQRLAQSTDLVTPALLSLWRAALAAPLDVAPTWLHGDLHPRNVLVDAGVLTGIIDWGDITAGDRATDLAAVWMLFGSAAARSAALSAYGPLSAATIARARGWAILLGAVLLETGLVDNPRNARIGAQTLRRVVEER